MTQNHVGGIEQRYRHLSTGGNASSSSFRADVGYLLQERQAMLQMMTAMFETLATPMNGVAVAKQVNIVKNSEWFEEMKAIHAASEKAVANG